MPVKSTHHAQDSRSTQMFKGFKGVLGVRVTLPFDFILGNAIHNAFANNGFNNVFCMAVGDLDRRRTGRIAGKRKWTGVEGPKFGDVEDRVNFHPRWKVELVGDGGDHFDDGPGALVLEAELGREILEGEILGGKEDTVAEVEGVIATP